VYGEFGHIDYKDKRHMYQVLEGVYKCILDDELAVKMEAACTMSILLQENKMAEDYLRPYLKTVLETYLKILTEVDQEEVFHAF
jgi:importin-7